MFSDTLDERVDCWASWRFDRETIVSGAIGRGAQRGTDQHGRLCSSVPCCVSRLVALLAMVSMTLDETVSISILEHFTTVQHSNITLKGLVRSSGAYFIVVELCYFFEEFASCATLFPIKIFYAFAVLTSYLHSLVHHPNECTAKVMCDCNFCKGPLPGPSNMLMK